MKRRIIIAVLVLVLILGAATLAFGAPEVQITKTVVVTEVPAITVIVTEIIQVPEITVVVTEVIEEVSVTEVDSGCSIDFNCVRGLP